MIIINIFSSKKKSFQNELREGSNEEEEEDDYEEDNVENNDKKMGISPNGLQIHITSDSVDLEESRIAP